MFHHMQCRGWGWTGTTGNKLWFGCVPTSFGECLSLKKFIWKLHKLDNFRLAKSWVMKPRFLACRTDYSSRCLVEEKVAARFHSSDASSFNVARVKLAELIGPMSTRCHSSLQLQQIYKSNNFHATVHHEKKVAMDSKLPIPSCHSMHAVHPEYWEESQCHCWLVAIKSKVRHSLNISKLSGDFHFPTSCPTCPCRLAKLSRNPPWTNFNPMLFNFICNATSSTSTSSCSTHTFPGPLFS